jgi:hypothetical protein
MTKPLLAMLLTFSASTSAYAGAAADRMAGEYEPVQLATLASVIRSADHACPSATKLLYMGDMESQNAGFWTVQCPAEDFVVMISNEGDMNTMVIDCALGQKIGAACWKKF